MAHNCRVCRTPLVVGENMTQGRIDTRNYICRICDTKRWNNWAHRTGRQQPMIKNRECSSFLGVVVAERVLSHVFKNVERMPTNNPGYDFICGRGYKVDVKSSCRRHRRKKADGWGFQIKKNQIAEYFLCLAFDSRDSLNPEHVWLIPAGDVNDHAGVQISESTLVKWDEYALDISKVSTCCNILKEE